MNSTITQSDTIAPVTTDAKKMEAIRRELPHLATYLDENYRSDAVRILVLESAMTIVDRA